MQRSRPSAPQRRIIWTLVTVVGVAVLGEIGFDVYRRAATMHTARTAAATVLAAKPGEQLKAVVRIESTTGLNTYAVELLESSGGTHYKETPTRMRLALAEDTAVIMGGAADLKPGAVVQVSGTTDETHTLHARKVVILSGYIRIVPGRS